MGRQHTRFRINVLFGVTRMKLDNETISILLVEDNQVDIDLTLMAFSRVHFYQPVKIARDGAEMLNLMESWKTSQDLPRLILLDINLPKVSGLEVLATLNNSALTKSIPVVMLTSSNNERDIKKAYELGANSYLIKPVDFDQFILLTEIICDYWIQLNVKPEVVS